MVANARGVSPNRVTIVSGVPSRDVPRLFASNTQTSAPDKLVQSISSQTAKENAQLATSWVVQVGSFSKQENAISLRNKIQKMGISSFISEAQSSTGRVYRVRVGPELKRSLADDLRKKIHKKFKLDGIVIRYP